MFVSLQSPDPGRGEGNMPGSGIFGIEEPGGTGQPHGSSVEHAFTLQNIDIPNFASTSLSFHDFTQRFSGNFPQITFGNADPSRGDETKGVYPALAWRGDYAKDLAENSSQINNGGGGNFPPPEGIEPTLGYFPPPGPHFPQEQRSYALTREEPHPHAQVSSPPMENNRLFSWENEHGSRGGRFSDPSSVQMDAQGAQGVGEPPPLHIRVMRKEPPLPRTLTCRKMGGIQVFLATR